MRAIIPSHNAAKTARLLYTSAHTHHLQRRTSQIDIWKFFRNRKGKITYYEQCRECIHTCKQSFRVKGMDCSRYESTIKNANHNNENEKESNE